MIQRWCCYLVVLGSFLGIYLAAPGWITWVSVLTVAGSPLVSVAISAFFGRTDALGLFRLPEKKKRQLEYVQELRPFRTGDPFSRVHWKMTAKTGAWIVREEQTAGLPLPPVRKRWVVPVALSFLILALVFPPGQYPRQMRGLQDFFAGKKVQFDLTAGPRTPNKKAVLDVVASESQLLYLRGQAFDVYDGTFWRAADSGEWSVWEPEGAVTVAARMAQDTVFAPYDGAEETPSKKCLQLPKETRVWAQALAEGKTVEQIQRFVRSCAEYDRNTEAMTGSDFARWFVEESGRGYCVHFATTAAVLLRAAGIPARFVTGYAVQVRAGLRKTVTGEDAHAWVEYWDGAAWRILEATPTMKAPDLPPAQKENRPSGGLGVLFLAIVAVMVFRKFTRKENSRLKELRQKAAFSQYGLNEEEKREMADILACLRKPKRERKGFKVKQEEKKPITWEVADPKPPVIQSGKMESRKQN